MEISIHILDDIFSNKHRKQLIKDYKSVSFLDTELRESTVNLGLNEKYRSSCTYIVDSFEKNTGIKLILKNAWISRSTRTTAIFHNHENYDLGCVYYMKTQPLLRNSGTMFRFPDGDRLFKAPQNSAILFPANLTHSVPPQFLPLSRYTLAMELNVDNRRD